MPSRRRFLGGIGTAGIVGLAGCSQTLGGGSDDTATETATDVAGGPTETDTATPTPTETGLRFGGDQELHMSISPSVPQRNLYLQYGPVRDYLQRYIEESYEAADGFHAEMNIGNNYSAVIQALGQGTSDVAETGPFAAALGVNAEKADIILQRKGYGSWTYVSQIAVAADSDIQSLADLSGKTVAFADRLSTSGCLYPLYDMKTEGGVDIGNLPGGNGAEASIDPVFAGGHVQAYEQLRQGQVDAAGMGGFVPGSVDNFESNATAIHKHEGLPRAPICVSPQLDDDATAAIQQAFLDAEPSVYDGADGEDGTDDDLWFSDVREASVDRYQSVVDVANELGVGTDIFETASD